MVWLVGSHFSFHEEIFNSFPILFFFSFYFLQFFSSNFVLLGVQEQKVDAK